MNELIRPSLVSFFISMIAIKKHEMASLSYNELYKGNVEGGLINGRWVIYDDISCN